MNTASCPTMNKRRKTRDGIGMLGLATLCSHSVSETFPWKVGKEVEKVKECVVPRQRTEEG